MISRIYDLIRPQSAVYVGSQEGSVWYIQKIRVNDLSAGECARRWNEWKERASFVTIERRDGRVLVKMHEQHVRQLGSSRVQVEGCDEVDVDVAALSSDAYRELTEKVAQIFQDRIGSTAEDALKTLGDSAVISTTPYKSVSISSTASGLLVGAWIPAFRRRFRDFYRSIAEQRKEEEATAASNARQKRAIEGDRKRQQEHVWRRDFEDRQEYLSSLL